MQIRTAGNHRQGLVGRVAADGCALRDRVAVLRQKTQVGPVGVIHQQRHALRPADSGQRREFLYSAQIIRAGDVYAKGGVPLLCQRVQRLGQSSGRDRTAAQRTLRLRRRPKPADIKIQQRRRVQQRLVGVAGSQQHRALAVLRCGLQSQKQHGADALGRALGAVIAVRRAKQPGGVGFAFGNDALRRIKLICTAYLGDIQWFKAQYALSLVAGHVQPGGAGLRIAAHKIHDGGGHAHSQASPSAQALQVEPSSMGTSMPLAASS